MKEELGASADFTAESEDAGCEGIVGTEFGLEDSEALEKKELWELERWARLAVVALGK